MYKNTLEKAIAEEVALVLECEFDNPNSEIRARIDIMSDEEYEAFIQCIVFNMEYDDALWEVFDNSIIYTMNRVLGID